MPVAHVRIIDMWKNKEEIKKVFLDHLDSVKMSGLGSESYRSEILSALLQAEKEFDEGEKSLPYSVLTTLGPVG